MAKIHKVLAIARLEESRQPLYVFTTELEGQGYSVETAYVRFENDKDEPKIMGDRMLSEGLPVDEYDGVVFFDDGGDIKESVSLAKRTDKAKKVVAGWSHGCLVLAKAGLLKDKFVCKGLPKGTFDKSKVVNAPSVRADNIVTSIEPTVDGFVVLVIDALGGKIKRTVVGEKYAFPQKSVLVVSKLPYWSEYWGMAERLAKDDTSVIIADWDDLDIQSRTIKNCLVLDGTKGSANLASEGPIPKSIWFKQTSIGSDESARAVASLESIGCRNANSSESIAKSANKAEMAKLLSAICLQGRADTYDSNSVNKAIGRLALRHGKHWVRAATPSPGSSSMSVTGAGNNFIVSSPGSLRSTVVTANKLANILEDRFPNQFVVQEDLGSLKFAGKEFRLAFVMRRKNDGWSSSCEIAKLPERVACHPRTVLEPVFGDWEKKLGQARELAQFACITFQASLQDTDGVRELGVEMAFDRSGEPSVVSMSSIPDLTARDAMAYGTDAALAVALAAPGDQTVEGEVPDPRADMADVMPPPGQDEHIFLLEREMAREGMWMQPDGSVAVRSRKDFEKMDLDSLAERLRTEAIEACRRMMTGGGDESRNAMLARRARHRLKLACQMGKWLGMTKSASMYPSGVSGPYSHTDLPMHERVFEFSGEEEDYLRDKDKFIRDQPRYNPEYEKGADPGDDYGFYFIWNEPRRSPEEWLRSLESEGVYITRKELRH